MDPKGKKALVFGGTSGMGLVTAQMLAAEGAHVVIISRDPSKATDVPDGVELAACDVRDEAGLTALFEAHAPFDILVSSATGGSRSFGPFLEMEMDGFKASFDKLWGYAHVVRYGTDHMSEDGTIVLVSGAPARKAKPGQVALSSVGGAVEALARAIAPEIAPRRINVVSPGMIDTPMIVQQGGEREAYFRALTEKNAIPRAGTSDEVAQAIMFLIHNDFTTGTTVDVDGGWLVSQ